MQKQHQRMMKHPQHPLIQQAALLQQQPLYHQIEPIRSGNLPPGFDPTQCRSVYVGNIHPQVTQPLLQEVFSTTGVVESCKLVRKEKSSYGFVHYFDRRSASLAIMQLNTRHLFGQPIKVNWAYISSQREDTSNHHSIFVGDLSPEVTDAMLYACFSVYPSCSDARVMWDQKTGRSRGFGFVAFRNQQDAQSAINDLTGKWLGSRQIHCNWATKGVSSGDDKQSSDDKSVVELTNGSSEDRREIANSDTPENNPQFTTVYMGNLAPVAMQLDLHRHFHGLAAGALEKVRVQRDKGSAHHKNSNNNSSNSYYQQCNEYEHHPIIEQSNASTRGGLLSQNQGFPALLPLPPILPLHLNSSALFLNQKPHKKRPTFPTPLLPLPLLPTPSNNGRAMTVPESAASDGQVQERESRTNESGRHTNGVASFTQAQAHALVVARRPDSGGVEGQVISLIANHFRVQFDPSQRVFHYDIEISPNPSKELGRVIKQKLVEDNSEMLSGAYPAFDGRRNLYSPVRFQGDRIELYVSLPIPTTNHDDSVEQNEQEEKKKKKLFRISIRLVSKLNGKKLNSYLSKDDEEGEWRPIPQDYLHALDVILRESSTSMENCIPVGRSLYSPSMGGSKDIGGGAVGLRGFFQSLRPTQQGLALNLDFAVTAFHQSVGVIAYLQKRFDFLRDLSQRKDKALRNDERKEVERALKNIRIFVSHRETVQRYRVHSLTQEVTQHLYFQDRDGERLRIVDYFMDHYNYDIQFRNLPCLQISRSKPCYLPMELCVICEGQKFLGKLSDDQTAKILNMGCQRPRKRREIIDGIINGPVGPTSGNQAAGFKLQVSREMTRLYGRVLHPPKLKLGEGGLVRDVVPTRLDCQWNLLGSHVVEGTRIERWTLISFGGTPDQKSNIPRFIDQLCLRCEQLGIFLNKCPTAGPQFESIQVLDNVNLLESKLKRIRKAASNSLQLLLCLMEKKHKGYADLKRIAETRVGVVTQCCLYPNLDKFSSQFLANIALKINAKVGGCTVALYNSLPSQIPRLLQSDQPVIFMGADVTHPHPLDDFSPSVAAVVGSMNWPSPNKYLSRIRSQTHRQEIIQDLGEMVGEILGEFLQEVSKLPERIVFFRDGVSETQFYKVLKEELQSIRSGCSSKFSGYNPLITFAVVQKRHHTRLFPDENDPNFMNISDENIPPGTVVDSVITHPREFDFYLCSHWGVKGTSRPAHYHVLWDESKFTSDEFQKLVYSLCFTFVRCTKPISIVPPAYYAHLAAYRGRLYLDRSESYMGFSTTSASSFSRAAPPKVAPLPKISEDVEKLMFYC